MSAEILDVESVDQDNQSEPGSEYDNYDPSLEDEIARLVENTELRDGWVLPIEQEDMAGVYESFGRMGPVDLEEGSQPGVQSGWGLDLEDIVWCVVFAALAYGAYKLLR